MTLHHKGENPAQNQGNVWEQLSKKQRNLSAQNVSICSLHFKNVSWKLLELEFSNKHSLPTPVSMKIKDWATGICHRGGIPIFAQLYPDGFCFVPRVPELKWERIDLGTATPRGEQQKLFYSLLSHFSFFPPLFQIMRPLIGLCEATDWLSVHWFLGQNENPPWKKHGSKRFPKTNSESLLVWAGENRESHLEIHR